MPRKLIGKLSIAGMQGPKGNDGKDYVITEKDYEEIAKKVEPIGIPKGGTTNQILQKKSDNDYDTEWVDNQAVGQVESVNGKTGKVKLTADDVGATTQEWVKEQKYLTEHQDISKLATKEEVTEVENKIPSLNGYATETWVENKGYLTEHQSLENYPTKQDVNTTVSNYHDNTKQDKLTPGNNITIDENNVISATGGGSGSLPDYPTSNGNYSLIATIVNGISTLSWKTISSAWQLPLQTKNNLKIFQGNTINQVKNNLEVI